MIRKTAGEGRGAPAELGELERFWRKIWPSDGLLTLEGPVAADRLQAVLDLIPDAAAAVRNGIIVAANNALAVLFGCPPDAVAGRYLAELVAPEVRAEAMGRGLGLLPGGCRSVGLRRDGTRIAIELRSSMIPLEAPGVAICVIRDLSADRREDRSRAAMRRVVAAQEAERLRIARDLHDQVGQTVTGLSLGLKGLEDAVDDPALRPRIAWLRALTAQISEDIHRTATELRPASLDDVGLVQAVAAFASEWGRRFGILVDVQADTMAGRLPADAETAVYRIVQEAFANILKHADARSVSVVIDSSTDELRAVVEDDGRGFDPGAADAARTRHGLSGMRERAALVGGMVRVDSAPGAGTSVYLRIPLPARLRSGDQPGVG